jgi:RNA polymerase sigma-70 factor (ECF subfamily)
MNLFGGETKEDPKMKERQIYNRLKKGDKEVFIEAYDLYIDKIYRFIYFKVSNKEEAQDITSSVFLKTWNYVHNNKLGEYKTLKALLYTIARNSVIDYYRKNNKPNTLEIDNEDLNIQIKDEKDDAGKKMDIYLDIKNVEEKLGEMKDEYREIIVLKYVEELTTVEISKILNKSKGNVRVLAHRALGALQKLVQDESDKQD